MPAQRNTRRVRLDQLFRWNHELEIKDEHDEVVGTVYQRVLNEHDLEKARLAALRATRNLRLTLRDENTDEHAAMMENLQQLDREAKVNIILLGSVQKLYERARREVHTRVPKPLAVDADLEQIEEYEHQYDTYEDRVLAETSELADKYTREFKEKTEQLPDEEFDAKVLQSLENQICMSFMTERFDEEITRLSVYVDDKFSIPYFDKFEDFDNLAAPVKQQLIRGYKNLSLNRGELKN